MILDEGENLCLSQAKVLLSLSAGSLINLKLPLKIPKAQLTIILLRNFFPFIKLTSGLFELPQLKLCNSNYFNCSILALNRHRFNRHCKWWSLSFVNAVILSPSYLTNSGHQSKSLLDRLSNMTLHAVDLQSDS